LHRKEVEIEYRSAREANERGNPHPRLVPRAADPKKGKSKSSTIMKPESWPRRGGKGRKNAGL